MIAESRGNDDLTRTIWVLKKGKNSHWARSGERGGRGKTVTYPIYSTVLYP